MSKFNINDRVIFTKEASEKRAISSEEIFFVTYVGDSSYFTSTGDARLNMETSYVVFVLDKDGYKIFGATEDELELYSEKTLTTEEKINNFFEEDKY